MFWADVSEFMALIKDHGQILLIEQGREDILKKTAEFGWLIPREFVPLVLCSGQIKKVEVSSQCLSG